ncbi:Hypothetical protein Bdt_1865 [Bdellovibrio bacteriovorus str. Tiberius]|uniref:Uncharacterized protein n=1 Tax=Bdellovibrio bacteriovorus str. Tiberius TaxID=1069642 RepID=K7ZFJ1_BDEBC|nr:Hypothetical protein Bdt_1865 [Bdellovibrio bacteriovorus str. Tiberius]
MKAEYVRQATTDAIYNAHQKWNTGEETDKNPK